MGDKEIIREFVQLLIECDDGTQWADITAECDESELGLDRPQVIVEPSVRDSIKKYFRAMGLTTKSSKSRKRAALGAQQSPQNTRKKNLWRHDISNNEKDLLPMKSPKKKKKH
jgi:hypothetical protein